MQSFREMIIDRVEYNIEMYKVELNDYIASVESFDEDDAVNMNACMRNIRDLTILLNNLKEGKTPVNSRVKFMYERVLEEMIRMDS